MRPLSYIALAALAYLLLAGCSSCGHGTLDADQDDTTLILMCRWGADLAD